MTALKQNKLTRGFTLIELLVVIGILAILLAITLIAINPARQFGVSNDTKRRSDATTILDAIDQYSASNTGNLPTDVVNMATGSATELNSANFPTMCAQLVTTYVSALPVDPSVPSSSNASPNGSAGISSCTTTPWDTGYQVSKDSSNRITVSAPDAYQGPITVTR